MDSTTTNQVSIGNARVYSPIYSNASNHSYDGRTPFPLDPVYMTYYYGCLTLVMIVNLTGNSLVLRTMYRHRCLWVPGNTFICSLAASDFLFGIVFPVYNVAGINAPGIKKILGNWSVCAMLMTEVMAMENCSAYVLVAITVTRYISCAFPLKYSRYVTSRLCIISIVLMWILSHTICALIYARQRPKTVSSGLYCQTCRYETLYTVHELWILTIVQFAVPASIMLTFYVKMALIARKHRTRITAENGILATDLGKQRYHRSFVIVTLLIGCFTASYVLVVIYIYFFMVLTEEEPCVTYQKYFGATARIVLFMNTAVNVFIYAGRMPDFRDCLRRDLAAVWPCSQRSQCANQSPTDTLATCKPTGQ